MNWLKIVPLGQRSEIDCRLGSCCRLGHMMVLLVKAGDLDSEIRVLTNEMPTVIGSIVDNEEHLWYTQALYRMLY